jgi:hypothetical protein
VQGYGREDWSASIQVSARVEEVGPQTVGARDVRRDTARSFTDDKSTGTPLGRRSRVRTIASGLSVHLEHDVVAVPEIVSWPALAFATSHRLKHPVGADVLVEGAEIEYSSVLGRRLNVRPGWLS